MSDFLTNLHFGAKKSFFRNSIFFFFFLIYCSDQSRAIGVLAAFHIAYTAMYERINLAVRQDHLYHSVHVTVVSYSNSIGQEV